MAPVDDEPTGAADGDAPGPAVESAADTPAGDRHSFEYKRPASPVAAVAEVDIVALPWDDDLPLALGEDTEVTEVTEVTEADEGDAGASRAAGSGADLEDGGRAHEGQVDAATDLDTDADADDLGELSDDELGGRRNALPRRVESWRTRSATGAIATALAMGLQQVFEPEKRRPAAVAEAPSDPYSDDDPVTVDYAPDDAEGTTVHVKPWLLQKGDSA